MKEANLDTFIPITFHLQTNILQQKYSRVRRLREMLLSPSSTLTEHYQMNYQRDIFPNCTNQTCESLFFLCLFHNFSYTLFLYPTNSPLSHLQPSKRQKLKSKNTFKNITIYKYVLSMTPLKTKIQCWFIGIGQMGKFWISLL